MKSLHFLRALALSFFVFSIVSCSSDNSAELNQNNNNGNNNGNNNTESQYFKINYNGIEYSIDSLRCDRTENDISLVGYAKDGRYFNIFFNRHGKIRTFYTQKGNGGFEINFGHDKDSFFDFQLININETDKTVEATFNGVLYTNGNDIDTAGPLVSGSFKVKYTDYIPEIPGIHFNAKINDEPWYGYLDSKIIEDPYYEDNIATANNNYEIVIRLPYEKNQINVGHFDLSDYSSTYKMFVKIYYSGLFFYITPDTGDLTITSVTSVNDYMQIVEGTFSFKAIDISNGKPINVENGSFKFIH